MLALLAEGLRNREIADRLVISEPTVKTHVRHVLEKLRIRNRAEAAAFAAPPPRRLRARGWARAHVAHDLLRRMPSTSATRPVVAPVRRASATASRSSALIGANARAARPRSASSTARSASVVASCGRRDHHALGDVLGDGLVARGGEGSGVDERQSVHAAMFAAARRPWHRPEG